MCHDHRYCAIDTSQIKCFDHCYCHMPVHTTVAHVKVDNKPHSEARVFTPTIQE